MEVTSPLVAIWECDQNEFTIQESSSEVDGVFILAKVVGPAFFPDTISENNVHYELNAWELALADKRFKKRLGDRLVFGTIGHNTELSDDDIRDGNFSHLVTRVWINEANVGMAEYLIYNTGPGQRLNLLLRTGSKLRVSTKAAGHFQKLKGQPKVKSVIPETFMLERIDFVIDPGYDEALPEVVESLQVDNINPPTIGEPMENTKVEQILEARINELKGEKSITESKLNELSTDLVAIRESMASDKVVIENYKQLGSFTSISESLAELAQYKSLGTVQEISEALEEGEKVIDEMTDKMTEMTNQPDEYEELGEPSEIKQALDKALEVVDELEAYQQLGSVDEISELLETSEQLAADLELNQAQALADELGVTVDSVSNLTSKGMSLDEVRDLVTSLRPESTPAPDVVIDPEPANEGDTEPSPEDDEEAARLEREKQEELEANESNKSSLSLRLIRQSAPAINESKAPEKPSRVHKLMTARR